MELYYAILGVFLYERGNSVCIWTEMVSIHHEVKDGSCVSCDDSIFQQKTLHLCIRRKSSEEVVYLSSSCFFILYCMIGPHPVAMMDVTIGGSWAKGTQASELVLQLSVSPKLFQNEKLFVFFLSLEG